MMALFCFRLHLCAVHLRFILPSRLSIFLKPTRPFYYISLGLSTSSGLRELFGRPSLRRCHSRCITIVSLTSLSLHSSCGHFNWWGTVGLKCASITLFHNPFWAVAFFSIKDNIHSGQTDDASVDIKLSLAYLYLMQYINLGFNTAQLSESSGHEQSHFMRGNFWYSHLHFLSQLQSVSELLTWGLILWWYPASRAARSEAVDTEPLSCCSLGTLLKQQAGDPVFLSEHQR